MMMHLTGSRLFSRPQPVPKMPPGLVELMEGMTREVLQHNPSDVYEFCAKHMEQLLIIRDGKAPKRYKLTLEQKIKIAQEKVRENAEQRWRMYDEGIKTKYAGAIPGTSSGEETRTGSINTDQDRKSDVLGEVESPVPEVNRLVKNVVEGKLKTPVHHEKELTEALEVEIFHKPLENVEAKNETLEESKVDMQSEQLVKAADKMLNSVEENDKENAHGDVFVTDSSQSVTSDVNINAIDAKALESEIPNLKQNLANEDIAFHDQIRVRRSIGDKENAEIEQETEKTNVGIPKGPETIIESVEECSETEITQSNTDEVSETKLSDDSFANVTDTNMNGQNTEILIDENVDKAATFADEIIESAPIPENFDEQIADAKEDDITEMREKPESILNSNDKQTHQAIAAYDTSIQIQVENDTSIDTNVNDENNEHTILEQFEESTEKETEKSFKNNGNEGIQEKSINSADSKNDSKLDRKEANLIEEQNVRSTEISKNLEPTPNGSVTLQEEKAVIKQEPVNNNKNDRQLKVNEKVSTEKENGEGPSIETDVTVENILSSTEDFITGERSPKNDKDPSSDPPENIERKSSTESSDHGTRPSVTTIETKKEFYTEQELAIDESTSPTTDKILVEESTSAKDDNDSAPVATTESGTKLNPGTEHMNGINTTIEVFRNGTETRVPNILTTKSTEETLKENAHYENKDDNVLDVQDNASTASEPPKTDSSSMEKTSSMEENILEEGFDNIVQVERIKSSGELAKDKENHMDLETAAVTIQKVFRSFLFKRSTFDDTGIEEANSIDEDSEKVEVEFPATTTSLNKERRTLGISRMDTVLQTVNEEKSLSLSTDDSSLSSAATIIQAHMRGFLVRNRLSSNRTDSASLGKSEGPSISFEADNEHKTNKTILNIHIVPEGEHFLSRDESLLTSMELSLDGSPPSSTNLHPLGYDKSEPRKQLKREDAVQSISPPSNNSGKLSEDVDSVKENNEQQKNIDSSTTEPIQDAYTDSRDNSPTKSTTIETVIEAHKISKESSSPDPEKSDPDAHERLKRSLEKAHSDESDVVCEDKSSTDSDNTLGLLHSGEFHDIVLPTKVFRADTTVVREFKNALVYFLLWNNAS